MEGEELCFWLFLLIWKDISFLVRSKSCNSPQKLFGELD